MASSVKAHWANGQIISKFETLTELHESQQVFPPSQT